MPPSGNPAAQRHSLEVLPASGNMLIGHCFDKYVCASSRPHLDPQSTRTSTLKLRLDMKTLTTLTLMCLLLLAGASHAQDSAWVPPGPAVGSTFPATLALSDQDGKPQTLK